MRPGQSISADDEISQKFIALLHALFQHAPPDLDFGADQVQVANLTVPLQPNFHRRFTASRASNED